VNPPWFCGRGGCGPPRRGGRKQSTVFGPRHPHWPKTPAYFFTHAGSAIPTHGNELETEPELHVLTTTALDQRPVLVVQKEDPLQVRTRRHPGVSAVGRAPLSVRACDEDLYRILNESLSGSAHGSVGSVGSGDNDEVARPRAIPFILVSGSSVPRFLR
jgi:hypothetical protein